jgi:hypothetical protein
MVREMDGRRKEGRGEARQGIGEVRGSGSCKIVRGIGGGRRREGGGRGKERTECQLRHHTRDM